MTGVDQQQTLSNYFVGGDSSQWQTGVANFSRVKYQNLYARGSTRSSTATSGRWSTTSTSLPANPDQIQWQIKGADGLSIDDAGNLLIHTAGSDLVEKAPTIYQDVDSRRAGCRTFRAGRDRPRRLCHRGL